MVNKCDVITLARKLLQFLRNQKRRAIDFINWDQWMRKSWSQEGEDRVLFSLLSGRKTGFYVDVGAHHPRKYSNTQLFYEMGWSGINIDAMPGSMREFDKRRPRDINIECGVGFDIDKKLPFLIFKEGLYNTLSSNLSDPRIKDYEDKNLYKVEEIKVKSLSTLFDENIPKGVLIDLLSIDVEGFDLSVLMSNDWSKYRPKFIAVEVYGVDIQELLQNEMHKYLSLKNYFAVAKTENTVIYKCKKND